jgi:ADP-heptose:LPS heptosyltransferase
VRPQVLVLRALGLGDFLTGVPALRAVRRALPGHEVVLAAPRVLDPLVRLAGVADRQLYTSGLEPIAWGGAAPDVVVNLHGRGPQSHRLLQGLHPGRLVAFDCAAAGHHGPTWRPEEHERDRWCRLLEESVQVRCDPEELQLRRPAVNAPAPGAVVVHAGAAYPSRRWPADRFAAVARALADQGHRVVLTGDPAEVLLADEVRRLAGLPEDAMLAGRTDLTALAAQVAAASLVICGDTGVAHLASAYGTPSVVLFGPVAPDRWGPPSSGLHRVLWHGDGTGDPWGSLPDPALLRIGAEEVLSAADRALLTSGARTTPGSS